MSNETKATENKPLSEEQGKKTPPRFSWFVLMIQEDFPEQMECLRFIKDNPDQFPIVICIYHDSDVYDKDDEKDAKLFDENGIYTRKNGDGSESQFRFGDRKPSHYHVLFKASKPEREKAMTKYFCSQVNAQGCNNEKSYAFYMTHETFNARKKHRYSRECVMTNIYTTDRGMEKYMEFTDQDNERSFAETCQLWQETLKQCEGDMNDAIGVFACSRDSQTLKKIAAHSNFFDKYFKHK